MRFAGGFTMTMSMNTFHVSPVATVLSVAVLGAVVIGGTRERPAGSDDTRVISIIPDRCVGGTQASAFVCRNTWMTFTKHAVR
jgi:hypothetical protein